MAAFVFVDQVLTWSMDASAPITELRDIRNLQLATHFYYAILATGFLRSGRKRWSVLLLIEIPFIPVTKLFAIYPHKFIRRIRSR